MLIEHKMFPYPQTVLNILSQNNISNKNSKLFLTSTDATESYPNSPLLNLKVHWSVSLLHLFEQKPTKSV